MGEIRYRLRRAALGGALLVVSLLWCASPYNACSGHRSRSSFSQHKHSPPPHHHTASSFCSHSCTENTGTRGHWQGTLMSAVAGVVNDDVVEDGKAVVV